MTFEESRFKNVHLLQKYIKIHSTTLMQDIEILLSTMNRENLDFLNPIFSNNAISDFKILIINQTTKDKCLYSNKEHIRVINSFEEGSPLSRNLALKNAQGTICLMADDDIVYKPNLKRTILEAYAKYNSADFISFEAINEFNKSQAKYPSEGPHNKDSLTKIFTWVITFRLESQRNKNIFYNHFFGVGSVFRGSTEYVFLRNAYDKGLKMLHYPKIIVMHPEESSGRKMGSDDAFFASSARTQRFYGDLSYLWLIKYTLFAYRNGYVSLGEIPRKFGIGLKGISKYKELKRSKEIDKIYVG